MIFCTSRNNIRLPNGTQFRAPYKATKSAPLPGAFFFWTCYLDILCVSILFLSCHQKCSERAHNIFLMRRESLFDHAT